MSQFSNEENIYICTKIGCVELNYLKIHWRKQSSLTFFGDYQGPSM